MPAAQQDQPAPVAEGERAPVRRPGERLSCRPVDDPVGPRDGQDMDAVRRRIGEPARVGRPGRDEAGCHRPSSCSVRPCEPEGCLTAEVGGAPEHKRAPIRRRLRPGVAARRGRRTRRVGTSEGELPDGRPPRRIGGKDLHLPRPVGRIQDAKPARLLMRRAAGAGGRNEHERHERQHGSEEHGSSDRATPDQPSAPLTHSIASAERSEPTPALLGRCKEFASNLTTGCAGIAPEGSRAPSTAAR